MKHYVLNHERNNIIAVFELKTKYYEVRKMKKRRTRRNNNRKKRKWKKRKKERIKKRKKKKKGKKKKERKNDRVGSKSSGNNSVRGCRKIHGIKYHYHVKEMRLRKQIDKT